MNGAQRKDRFARVPWIAMGFALAVVFIAVRMIAVLVLSSRGTQ